MIVLASDFMTKICKKGGATFSLRSFEIFDRVKSANIRKLAKDHKGYGSPANTCITIITSSKSRHYADARGGSSGGAPPLKLEKI